MGHGEEAWEWLHGNRAAWLEQGLSREERRTKLKLAAESQCPAISCSVPSHSRDDGVEDVATVCLSLASSSRRSP